MIKKITLLFCAVVISICAQAQNFTAVYTFDSVKTTSGIIDPTPVPTATGVTFGSFTANGVSVNPTATARFSYKTWTLGATSGSDVYANLTGSLSTSKYYEVSVSPASGYKISLTGIKFKVLRSSTGIRTYSVRSSADGFTTNLPASINPVNAKLSVQTGDVFFWNYDSTSTSTSLGGNAITLTEPSFTNISSTVKFRFYAWNAEGATGTFSIDNDTIFGSALAVPIIAKFSADTACFGNSTNFTDLSTSSPGTITNWKWNFGDGSALGTVQNPSHLYSTRGTKNVKLIVTDNSANVDSISGTVYIDSLIATLTKSIAANVVTFTGSASYGMPPYLTMIDFGDGSPISANPNSVHPYTASGPYTACLTVSDTSGCLDSSCVSFTIIGTGINSSVIGSISIFPNPSVNCVFIVNTGNPSNKTMVTVYNIIGEEIFSKEVNSAGKQTIDLSNEPNGCYFMNIKNDKENITKKITISK